MRTLAQHVEKVARFSKPQHSHANRTRMRQRIRKVAQIDIKIAALEANPPAHTPFEIAFLGLCTPAQELEHLRIERAKLIATVLLRMQQGLRLSGAWHAAIELLISGDVHTRDLLAAGGSP